MGAAVDSGVFAEDIVIAHFEIGRLAEVFQVLGFAADGRIGKKLVAAPELRVSFQHDMRVQHAIIAQLDVGAHHAERADAHVVSDLGKRRDDGGGVDHRADFRRWRDR